jgi:MEDS: MEthanogen/methylotroph, DcmR Sensory domain
MNEPMSAVGLAGAELRRFGPVCAFFHDREEEDRVLLPLAREGFERGEKVLHIVDPEHLPERMRRLNEAGISPAAARRPDQVEVRVWQQAHLRGGCFDQRAMCTLLEGVPAGAKDGGFPRTRLWSNQEWALGDRPGVQDLLEYETRVNYFLPKYDDLVVCTFDLNKFGGGVVLDILRTHPMVIIGGVLQEHPFYVPPDEFLRELRERDAATPQC